MPIYEYECPECENCTEELRPFHRADDAIECLECGAEMLRIMSLSSFQLKGGGWYEDGYASPTKPTKNTR